MDTSEEVNGIIIGGDFVGWQLYYDNRPQSNVNYADNEREALILANAWIKELQKTCKGYPLYLYPDDSLWTIRLT